MAYNSKSKKKKDKSGGNNKSSDKVYLGLKYDDDKIYGSEEEKRELKAMKAAGYTTGERIKALADARGYTPPKSGQDQTERGESKDTEWMKKVISGEVTSSQDDLMSSAKKVEGEGDYKQYLKAKEQSNTHPTTQRKLKAHEKKTDKQRSQKQKQRRKKAEEKDYKHSGDEHEGYGYDEETGMFKGNKRIDLR